jgi:Rnl2 family RNA ligase
MELRRFNSLKNTYMDAFIERVHRQGYTGKWVVTEKLHGANLSVHCFRNEETRVASREQYVDDSFYGARDIIAPTRNKVESVARRIFAAEADVVRVVLYGELTGPHMMNKHPVWYGDQFQFHAFELVITHLTNGELVDQVMSWDALVSFCKSADIPTVPLIGIFETFEDALAVNETFTSLLTPNGYERQNYAEGVTIAPVVPQFSGETRIWLKKKTEHHNERQKRPRTVENKSLDETGVAFAEYLLEFVNAQRVDAVLSKLGHVDPKQQGRIMGMALKDAYEEAAACLNEEEGVDTAFTIKEWAKQKVGDQWPLVNQLVTKEMAKVVNEALVSTERNASDSA